MKEAFFVVLGWLLGFGGRYIESRWQGAHSLRGALRACQDDLRQMITLRTVGRPLDKVIERLNDDVLLLRQTLVANPILGNEWWVLYRRLSDIALSEAQEDILIGWEVQYSMLHEMTRRGGLKLLLPGLDRRLAQARVKAESRLEQRDKEQELSKPYAAQDDPG